MKNREPTSWEEFDMDVKAFCRLTYLIFNDPNERMKPEDYIFLEKQRKLFTRIINRLLARHHPRWAHPEKNPNYKKWHAYAGMKWQDTLYRILELRYTKLT